MRKDKLMIIGAAKFQVPLIELAKQMGFETIVVSIAGNYPGFFVADRSCEIDVRDKETILEVAKREKIRGIVSDQTDLAVPTVAYVAEKMGLPGIGYECARTITDKLKCRLHCQKNAFPIPAFSEASNFGEAKEKAKEIGFPIVVKPTDSMAARGVALVNDFDELARVFPKAVACASNGIVVLEKFFQGKKIAVVGFKSDSEIINLIVADHDNFDIPGRFIVSKVLTPSLLSENLQKEVWAFHNRLFESFGLNFGLTYSELRVNEESGELCLMEATPRGPAGFVSSHLIPLARGIDVVPLLIEFLSGRRLRPKMDKKKFLRRSSGNIYFYLLPGIVRRVDGIEQVKALPGIYRTELDGLEVGKKIPPIENLSGRQGPLVYAGKNRAACEEIIHGIKAVLTVEVETPQGTKGIVWS